jgi:hypothetical protein
MDRACAEAALKALWGKAVFGPFCQEQKGQVFSWKPPSFWLGRADLNEK